MASSAATHTTAKQVQVYLTCCGQLQVGDTTYPPSQRNPTGIMEFSPLPHRFLPSHTLSSQYTCVSKAGYLKALLLILP